MDTADRDEITKELREAYETTPFWYDSVLIGPMSRPRLYWPSWRPELNELEVKDSKRGYYQVSQKHLCGSPAKIQLSKMLDPGVTKCRAKLGDLPFPTSLRWLPRDKRPEAPAGIEDCDEATLAKWEASKYAMAPYQFKKELGVITKEGVDLSLIHI